MPVVPHNQSAVVWQSSVGKNNQRIQGRLVGPNVPRGDEHFNLVAYGGRPSVALCLVAHVRRLEATTQRPPTAELMEISTEIALR